MRTTRNALMAAAVITGLVALSPVPPVAAASPNPATHRVIVLLRNQHADVPPSHPDAGRRVALTNRDQAPLVARAKAAGATAVRQLHVVNAFAASVSPAEQATLMADPAVAAVVPDHQVSLPRSNVPDTVTTHLGSAAASAAVCPSDPTKPLLEPEALQLTRTAFSNPATKSAQQLATGKGVKVAFLADGLDVDNPDFIRADGSKVFVDYRDFSGDGPLAPTSAAEAFGDASSIAAQGRKVYDLANFVNPAHPLPAGCTITVRGMAPDASLVGLKVFPSGGFAFNSAVLAALDYAVTVDKVDVINESFGSNQYPDTTDDPTAVFNEQLVAAGITITASSGDAAGENTIGSPASTPGVISVGGTTSFRGYAQTAYNGFQLSNGRYVGDNISGLSSSGITQPGRTIDLVAPGDLGWALCTPNTELWQGCVDNKGAPSPIQLFGGTSQSAPLVAGAAALVIQAYRDTHHGATPAPALVRRMLTGTATDLGLPGSEQGAGLLNARRAVEAARSAPGSTTAKIGNNVMVSVAQLDVAVRSGGSVTKTVTVTNVGQRPQLLLPSLRTESTVLRRDDFSVTLSPTTDPTFINQVGGARSYRTQTFRVPAGASRLTAAVAWPGSGQLVRFFLLDPSGTYTAYTIPQGIGNYGFADVHKPKPGTWTAYLVTSAGAAGFAGAVDFTTTSYRNTSVGAVTPRSLVLRPGRSRTLRLRIPAGDVGDGVDALQLASPSADVGGVVPVVVRTLVATGARGGTFTGTFGGGNGRAGVPNPSRTYDFEVPAGKPDLAVNVTVRGNSDQAVYGFLIDPNGEPVNEQTNQTVAADGGVTYRPSLQFDHRAPQTGRWRVVFAVFGPIGGTSTTTSYSGQVGYGLADVSASGLPNDRSLVLKAGVPVTATIRVVNRGAATANYFADGRLSGRVDLVLAGRNATGYQLAPAPVNPFPAFQIPTGTNGLTVRSTSDRPINFEASPFPADHLEDLSFEGDPDVEAGPAGLTPTLTLTDPIVAPQTWLMLPSQIGPFAATAPTATASFTATAHTYPFDLSVKSSTGDPQLGAVQVPAPAVTPLQLASGAAGTITIAVTPAGPKGHVVRGTLYVGIQDPVTGSSDEVAAVPYTYTIG